jgi:hypothetical protein
MPDTVCIKEAIREGHLKSCEHLLVNASAAMPKPKLLLRSWFPSSRLFLNHNVSPCFVKAPRSSALNAMDIVELNVIWHMSKKVI